MIRTDAGDIKGEKEKKTFEGVSTRLVEEED